MKSYTAYAVTVDSDLDLATQVSAGEGGRLALSLRRDDGLEPAALPASTLSFQTHGRDLQFRSSEALDRYREGLTCALIVDGVIDFLWRSGSRDIRYRLTAGVDEELAAFWVVNLFLPAWLSLEGHYQFIHASSVVLDQGAVLFSAPSWGGKSTLAERFLRHGHRLVSDDKVALRRVADGYRVAPSHHRYRPYRGTEDLGYVSEHFSAGELPLRAIYLLRRPDEAQAVSIAPVRGFHRFAALLPNHLFNFRHLRAERMEFLARLTDRAPLFLLEVPNDLERVEEIYRAVCRHGETGFPAQGLTDP